MIVLITGISRGIGRALVEQACSSSRFTKVIGVSRNQDALNEMSSLFDVFEPIHFDIAQEDFTTLNNALSSMPHIDVLINNAGYLVNKPFAEWSHQDLYNVYNINSMAPFKMIQSCYSKLKKSLSPHVINISSMGGIQGAAKFPGLSGYSSAKGAVNILTECLAEEFKEENIVVNSLSLGAVQTEMLAEAFPGYQAPVLPDDMAKYILEFSLSGHKVMNGKLNPLSLSTP